MRAVFKLRLVTLVAILVGSTLGCRPSGPERQAVTGRITLDGQPVQRASIVFQPVSSGAVTAIAVIHEGQFRFSGEDGPTLGNYRVRLNPADPDLEQEGIESLRDVHASRGKIPIRYQQFGALTVDVTPSGLQPATLELTSKTR